MRWVVGLVLGILLSVSLPGCGGQVEVDATRAVAQLEAKAEEILQRIRDTPFTVQSRELQQLVDLFWELKDQIKRLEDEARGNDRATAPEPPASGVQ